MFFLVKLAPSGMPLEDLNEPCYLVCRGKKLDTRLYWNYAKTTRGVGVKQAVQWNVTRPLNTAWLLISCLASIPTKTLRVGLWSSQVGLSMNLAIHEIQFIANQLSKKWCVSKNSDSPGFQGNLPPTDFFRCDSYVPFLRVTIHALLVPPLSPQIFPSLRKNLTHAAASVIGLIIAPTVQQYTGGWRQFSMFDATWCSCM